MIDAVADQFQSDHDDDDQANQQAISNGCIRLKNKDVVKLKNKLPLGSPVKIK